MDFFYMSFINVTPTSDFTSLTTLHAAMFLIFLYCKPTLVTPTWTINIFLTWLSLTSLAFPKCSWARKYRLVVVLINYIISFWVFHLHEINWLNLHLYLLTFLKSLCPLPNQLPNLHLYLEDFQLSHLYIFIKSPK